MSGIYTDDERDFYSKWGKRIRYKGKKENGCFDFERVILVNDLKILWKYFREHKLAAMAVVAATFSGAVAGGVLGVLAYYHGWLG